MSNEKKTATLGIPHGTATNRLRKMLLFRQLQKHGENVCMRCGKLIDSIEQLSIEHIKPWEGVSAELFWDLDNIAFSHASCNRPHKNGGGIAAIARRKVGPEGTAWCISHQKFEPIENFWKDSSNWNGLQKYCKETKIK